MDTELALKINEYIHDQCKNGVPHDIGFNVVKLFCKPVVVGRSEHLAHCTEDGHKARRFLGGLKHCDVCGYHLR